jgi:hypothetical protein
MVDQVFAILMGLGLVAFGLFTGINSASLFIEQIRAWRGARKSQTWAVTNGAIETSKMTWRGVRSPRAHPVVTYHYQVNGQTYLGERISFSYARIYSTAEAEAILVHYASKSKVMVYYDPDNPKESTLEQRHSSIASGVATSLVLLLPTCLCLMAGLIGLAQTLGK